MDVKLAKPFVDATIEVLSTMAQIKPVVGKPYVKSNNMATGDVTGVIGVTGDEGLTGVISVTFSKSCAVAIVKNLLGGAIEDIVKDVQDAVGEIANMISGQARQRLVDMGVHLSGATPTVIMGDNHTVSHVTKDNIMVVPFKTDHGDFVVEFSMNK